MPSILIVGIIIFVGFICGELLRHFGLPKVTGYILGGVLLNPGLFKIVPYDFVSHTGLITNISLSFITFSVGGALLFPEIKKLGKTILFITILEAEFAFLLVFLGFFGTVPFLTHIDGATAVATFIPLSLLIASLASPTDPSATLAVVHEYKAKGRVSSTIMNVAAFDDVLGIINYSFATVAAVALITREPFSLSASVLKPGGMIVGAVFLGIILGVVFNALTEFFNKETEGALIVVIFALLFICFGLAKYFDFDELLATMSMGAVVVNFNRHSNRIFTMLERYTEEFIFVLFFTVSGMLLTFSVLPAAGVLIFLFFIFRTIGKFLGTYTGAVLSGAERKVRRYTAGGLIPQGGIVVGLVLLIQQDPAFSHLSQLIMSVIIGATIVHEFIGPISAKIALKKAGEI
ncbi:MAG: cation:proton antiporter [Candidatus Omnitrophica bacterium]|nr:cation:proton antiporter [Candidatus Omnitrophota bacterium]